MFYLLLAEQPRSEKSLPWGESLISYFPQECPNGGRDQGKDHPPLFLLK